MLPTGYPALLAFHLLFMVTFFAGTFGLLRLLVLHRQALALWEPDRGILVRQYGKTERSLLYLVAWPSLLLLLGFGAWMAWLQPALLKAPWMQAKLGLTALLFAYHLADQRIYRRLQAGTLKWGVFTLRIWAQGSVLLLVTAVFLSVFKAVQWYIGVLGLLVLAALLWAALRGPGGGTPSPTDAETGSPGT